MLVPLVLEGTAALLVMLVFALLFVVPVLLVFRGGRSRSSHPGLPGLRAEAVSVRSRLGADVAQLEPGDDAVARQALADAAERHAASGALLERARTPAQLATAHRTALEGLAATRVVRQRLGLDPGPEIALPRSGPQLTEPARVRVAGHDYVGSPRYEPGRHWYGGGYYQGHPVPAGWYDVPFWQSALLGGAVGGLLGGWALGQMYDSGPYGGDVYAGDASWGDAGTGWGDGDGGGWGDAGWSDGGGGWGNGGWSDGGGGWSDGGGGWSDGGGGWGDAGGDFAGGDFGGGGDW